MDSPAAADVASVAPEPESLDPDVAVVAAVVVATVVCPAAVVPAAVVCPAEEVPAAVVSTGAAVVPVLPVVVSPAAVVVSLPPELGVVVVASQMYEDCPYLVLHRQRSPWSLK